MIHYRLATRADNQQLIELTASSAMPGVTRLRIDRKPDFFRLLQMRGESSVFVALDGDAIIGCICVSLQQVTIGGEVFPLQYIGDFKVAETHRNRGIGLQLCNKMASHIIGAGADLAFLNISKGNTKPVSFFKGRPSVPDFDNIGIFNIHQFIGKKQTPGHPVYSIEPAVAGDACIRFINSSYCRYELGPVVTNEQLKGTIIFIIREGKEIIAAMCLSDTMDVKQNVVTGLSFTMKCLLKMVNTYSAFSGLSKMPLINQPVRMLYIKYLVARRQDKELIRLLVNYARNIVYEKAYSFASIGLHEKDPLNKCFAGISRLSFNSVGMLVSIKNNRSLIEKVKQGVPFEDYSLV